MHPSREGHRRVLQPARLKFWSGRGRQCRPRARPSARDHGGQPISPLARGSSAQTTSKPTTSRGAEGSSSSSAGAAALPNEMMLLRMLMFCTAAAHARPTTLALTRRGAPVDAALDAPRGPRAATSRALAVRGGGLFAGLALQASRLLKSFIWRHARVWRLSTGASDNVRPESSFGSLG